MTLQFLFLLACLPLLLRTSASSGRHSCRKASRLIPMQLRQLCQNRLATLRKVNPHEAAVRLALDFADQPSLGCPLHQADHRVVTLLQKFGQFTDGCRFSVRVTRDPEEQLMLLRSDTFRSRRLLAETQESPQVITEPGKVPDQLSIQDLGVTAGAHRREMPLWFHRSNYITL